MRRFAGHAGLVNAVAFTVDGKWGISGGFDGAVVVWKVGTGDEIWRVDGLGAVAGIAVDPQGRFVAVGAGTRVRVFDTKTGRAINDLPSDHGRVSAIAVQPNGQRIVFGTEPGTIVVWDWVAGGPWRTLSGHVGAVRALAVRYNRWVLSAGSDRSVKLWDLTIEKDVAEFRKHAAVVVSAAFLSNGTQTLSGDRDLNVLPWKIDTFFTAAPVPPPVVVPKVPDKIPVAKP